MSKVFGNIRQIAYVVPDIHAAIDRLARNSGIGPWFVYENMISSYHSKGNLIELELTMAFGNSGDLQIELIQQMSPQESIYTEFLKAHPQADRPHHYAAWPENFEDVRNRAFALGYVVLRDSVSPRGQMAYFHHPDQPAFICEVTELTPARKHVYASVATAAKGWDGTDPVRPGIPYAVPLSA